ncbi:GNAT family N-acetyltransferase/peptidase C39 family protein [Jiella mangrovi]|uniref:GNAT family N-acetyltransferase/peptidase C39 family protein n=1 Tax=Jiella mangrovi TaxID=2821407 RepID=A0ABS4BEE8_9HYPH|nr:GNAT family N-acetyltransferase/peptidase C39 family protein [Jiella mangrovi]MBP0615138.1 GNAT family N-acetyltransferase/peptidase C39 family protein [Jiella mangrovi]
MLANSASIDALDPSREKEPLARLRPATAEDIDALVALEEASFVADRITRRSFRNLIGSPSALIIVACGGDQRTLAGYAALLFRRGTALARLYSLAVAVGAAGKGIGRALLKAAETEAFERDRILLRLEVREDNERAIKLYRANGYRPIGRYLDYYDDHMPALRFEKTLRGEKLFETGVPYYEQTTDFTCGSCCLMMAMARDVPGFRLDPVMEIRLWREATTIFMMSGPGGCDPFGLAVTAHEFGLDAQIHVSQAGDLFLEGVRNVHKQKVMMLAQEDFRRRAAEYEIPTVVEPFTLDLLSAHLKKGGTAIVLVSGYHMFAKKVPHWVLAHGDDGRHIVIHDPWVADEKGESIADAAYLPLPYATFDKMARFGKSVLRAAVFLSPRRS